jgi:hypothetical protein
MSRIRRQHAIATSIQRIRHQTHTAPGRGHRGRLVPCLIAIALQKNLPAPAIAPQTPDHSQARTPTHKTQSSRALAAQSPALYTLRRIKPPVLNTEQQRTEANGYQGLFACVRPNSRLFASVRKYRGARIRTGDLADPNRSSCDATRHENSCKSVVCCVGCLLLTS